MLENPEKREAMIVAFRRLLPQDTLDDPRRPILENLLRTDDGMLCAHVEKFSLTLAKQLSTRRIYCLTPSVLGKSDPPVLSKIDPVGMILRAGTGPI
jgi:hypothetical protein